MTVTYTPPTGQGAVPLQDAAGNEVAAFTTGEDGVPAVENDLPAQKPGAPEDLAAQAGAFAGSMVLTWSAAHDNGSAILRYQLRHAPGESAGGADWEDIPDSGPDSAAGAANANGATVTGLAQGRSHSFEVRAVNGEGSGPAAAVTGRGLDDAGPVAAAGSVLAERHAQLAFNEALDTDAQPEPGAFGFTVTAGDRTRTFEPVRLVINPGRAITLNLAPADAIRPGETVSVAYTPPPVDGTGPAADRLKDLAGNPAPGFGGFAVDNPLFAQPPEAPVGLAVAAGAEDGSAVLTWTTPWANGSAITGYQVRRTPGAVAGGTWEAIPGSGPDTTSHTVTGLIPGTGYTFQVRALNRAAANGGAGEAASAAEGAAPEAAGAEVAAGSGGRTVTLTFGEALDAASQPAAGAFAVTAAAGDAARTVAPESVAPESVAPESVAITGTGPDGGAYEVTLTLAAADAVRPGERVSVAYTRPEGTGADRLRDAAGFATQSFDGLAADNRLPAAAPEAPGNLAATAPVFAGQAFGDRMTLSWQTPWANGSAITGYQLRRKAGNAAWGAWSAIPGSGPETTGHTAAGLAGATQYSFQLRALNDASPNGGAGDAATVAPTTAALAAPGAPADLAAGALKGQAVLTWQTPRHNGAPVTCATKFATRPPRTQELRRNLDRDSRQRRRHFRALRGPARTGAFGSPGPTPTALP